jgi:hypothetical protein
VWGINLTNSEEIGMGFVVGCVVMLLVFAGSSVGYWQLLSGRSGNLSWFAIPLGISVTLVFGQIWGLFAAFARIKLVNKSAAEWGDGEFVGISGPLRPLKDAVVTPATGKQALAVEYSLERRVVQHTSNSNSVAYRKEVSGFLMAPSALYQRSGPIRVIGFPRPEHFESSVAGDVASLERFAKFLTKAQLTPLTLNPLAAFRAFTSVLKDDEGEVSRHFCNSDSPLSLITKTFNRAEQQLISGPQEAEDDSGAELETLIQELVREKYRITERWIPLGVNATVYGIYRKSQRAIDVGTELTALQRGEVKPGELRTNVYKGILASVLLLTFWVASAIVGHYLLVKEVREYIDPLLPTDIRRQIHEVIKGVLPEGSEVKKEWE